MNNCCKFNWFSTFVLHKNKTSVIQSLMKIARDNKNLVQNEIETIEKAIELLHENEKLKQEIENLKYKEQYLTGEYMIDDLMNTIDELQIKLNDAEQENENLTEALRKCRPLQLEDVNGFCCFCNCEIDEIDEGHSNDCEYLKLTGGQNETK